MKKNPFKEIWINKDVPPEIKKTVMSEIALINLTSEVVDLFTVKFASVFEDLFMDHKKRKQEV